MKSPWGARSEIVAQTCLEGASEEAFERLRRRVIGEYLEGVSEEYFGRLHRRVTGERFTRYLLRSAFKEFLMKTSGVRGRVTGKRLERYVFWSAFTKRLSKTFGNYIDGSLACV